MNFYTTSKIARIVGGQLISSSDPVIRHIIFDSRKMFPPENSLFIAIVGQRHDGHNYIPELYQKGVKNFLVSKNFKENPQFEGANFIKVPNPLGAFQQLASYHRNQFDYPVIGITGSNGKTIIKEWIYHVLSDKYNIIRSPKSYNSQIGVPLSVWNMTNEFDLAVYEAGISKPGEMQRLQNIIRPRIGIFSNIGEAHQENFENITQKIREKLEFFIEAEVIIYCKDHEEVHREIIDHEELKNNELITWSLNYDARLMIDSINKQGNKTTIAAYYDDNDVEIEIPFIDKGSIENAIHIWLLLLYLGIDNEYIKDRMINLPVIAMRLEMKRGVNQCTLINDSYNSDLGSLNIALNMLNQQNQHKKKTVILSDILQSGRSKEDLYNDVDDLLKRNNVDRLIGIGHAITEQSDVFDVESKFYTSTEQFMKRMSVSNFQDEAILLKGSRDFHFEKISNLLEEKVHQTVLEIDLDAMLVNLNYFRSKIHGNTKIMAMVKAFSYGSGTYEIANLLQYHKVDYLGVAFTDEGIALREAGIGLPIVVMSPEEESFELMVEYELEPELYNFRVMERFNHEVGRMGKEEYPVHIKLDTGMNRLGFKEEELPALIKSLKSATHLKVVSVFSHLAASEDSEQDEFTNNQIDIFDKISNTIIQELGYPVLRHILNSAGIERFPSAQFDMVRLGIGLYGISAVEPDKLQNISKFKSTVTQIKKVAKNETIGYGRVYKANREKTIAVVPVGYADGLRRGLSNGVGRVYINGNYVPIVGNICMDMCMVDVTGYDIKEGDEVVIFGDEIPVSELAEKLDTIPYEIFTGISNRVKRIYYQE
ncbi:MAG: bifunctional UDP-N-acetylmuramoyl-tripeptide:D-alanyl-D-alanine ligase/alanine racemase [Bacteroidales bacterium]